jgi:hypothetical protein
MKQLGAALVLALGLVLAACGTGSGNSNNVTGNWTATLTNPDGSPAFSFTTSLTQHSDNTVSGTNLNFTSANPCFANGATETGGFMVSGNTNGVTTGGFQLILTSNPPNALSHNVLTLNGTLMNGNTISGVWTLTGLSSGCTGSGTFTMTRM